MIAYTYVYLDPRKPFNDTSDWKFSYQPFYVGMGTGNRKQVHVDEVKRCINKNFRNHKKNTIKAILSVGLEPIIEVIEIFESRESAGNLEKEIIQFFGRADNKTGILTNLTDGGDGVKGLSECWWKQHNKERSEIFQRKMKEDEIFRKKFIENHSGDNHWTAHKEFPIEGRLKISNTLKGKKTWSDGVSMKDHFQSKERYIQYKETVSNNSKTNYKEIKKGKSSRFIKTTYRLFNNDEFIIEITGSREFYKYCKENLIDYKDDKQWKLEKK